MLKRFTPSRWIAFIATAWGIIATLTGLASSYGSLVACRLLLGAVEAGLFPGLNVYLTFFYTKNELALRVGYLFVSAAIAGAVGGLLAYAIGNMDGVAGMHGWRVGFPLIPFPLFVPPSSSLTPFSSPLSFPSPPYIRTSPNNGKAL